MTVFCDWVVWGFLYSAVGAFTMVPIWINLVPGTLYLSVKSVWFEHTGVEQVALMAFSWICIYSHAIIMVCG